MLITARSIEEGAILCIDKPLEWTSHDVVARLRHPLRKFTGNKKLKVGHAGTLDPLATGLLLVLTGKATKQAEMMQNLEKEYTGTITLGGTTESYDLETAVQNEKPTAAISDTDIMEAAAYFTCTYWQTPPAHSSVKIDGKPSYTYAREGEVKEIKKREVHIYRFEILSIRMPVISFRVQCSKGTYIRSLAHDFGAHLQCGGYLSSLRRTHIGNYSVEGAYTLETLLQELQLPGNTDDHSTGND